MRIGRGDGRRRRHGRHAVVEHVDDRAADLGVAQVGEAAARGHRPVPVHCRSHQRVEPALQSRDPGRPVADLRRAVPPGLVAGRALRADDRFAAAHHRRCRAAHRFDPMASRLVDHVGDRALDLDVADTGIAAVRGHVADALDGVVGEGRQALRGSRRPGLGVADARRVVLARKVAGAADGVDHVLALPLLALGMRRRDEDREGGEQGERGQRRASRDGSNGRRHRRSPRCRADAATALPMQASAAFAPSRPRHIRTCRAGNATAAVCAPVLIDVNRRRAPTARVRRVARPRNRIDRAGRLRPAAVGYAVASGRRASRSISTRAPRASAVTPMQVRAGRRSAGK